MSGGAATITGTIFMLPRARSPVPAFQFLRLRMVCIGY